MTYMKFKTENGIHMATNCPVELDIVEFGNDTYAVSTAKSFDEFNTFDEAVRFAEHKFGIVMEMETV